jgi:hypothetical protein
MWGLHPEVKPRIIADDGPQFIATDFKDSIPICGMTAAIPRPPQTIAPCGSNGNIPQFERALELVEAHHLSVWDACIVAAAETARCGVLYTEDLAGGCTIGNVRILNPLKSALSCGRS